MLVKIVTFFLIALAVLAMLGGLRVRRGHRGGRPASREGRPGTPRRCPDCGGYVIGTGPCTCKSAGGRR
jgi:hypothetical protein